MAANYKKKLIEVAIPLEAINAASAREKSIRHGHPSTLHLWWARRPLAACRAVLFAQLVDDPSSRVDELLADKKLRARAEAELPKRVKAWEESKAAAKGAAASAPKPTLEDVIVEIERKRLFDIIEELVKWENSTNEEVLERARAEIRRSCGGELPPVYDPFSGGGSIPLEAQRLGLPAYGSDLNPVAVMIGKAMIEIPPKFKDMPPIHPGVKARQFYRNAEGLAEDVKYYGEWMREKAWERIGHLYPQVDLPKEYGGGKATVVAWLWARTVHSPDPAFSHVQVPLASSFLLTPMKGKEAYIETVVAGDTYHFEVRNAKIADLDKVKAGTKAGRGSNFVCIVSGAAITGDYIKAEGQAGRMGARLMAIVAEGKNGRFFLSPSADHEEIAAGASPTWKPAGNVPERLTGGTCVPYGLRTWADIFTDRQILALDAFAQLVSDVRGQIRADALQDEAFSRAYSDRVDEYADAVSVFLGFLVSKLADKGSTLCTWDAGPASNKTDSGRSARVATVRVTFGRQALPMTWDFAEVNFFSNSVGSIDTVLKTLSAPLLYAPRLGAIGSVVQHDAQTQNIGSGKVLSTDPPYYDNIAYADLSDFFYVWLRRSLGTLFPEALSTISTPKQEELVASAYRHGGRDVAEEFFLSGMKSVVSNLAAQVDHAFPATVYYAFKQSEVTQEGISSTGWATFLEAIVSSGFSVVGTWPVRTEMASRMIASGTNALANSVVLVCRKKEATAETITRAEFIRALKRELPPAIAELQAASIAPADMPQSAIGPGMGVFSRYKSVLEADDSPMTVKTALQLINAELDEYLGGIQGEFDADTRFAITWFEQNGMGKGDYGVADNLARARGIAVESVKHAGIVESAAGKVRLLRRDELDADWTPEADAHLTVWECLQQLVRLHENDGVAYSSALMLKKIGDKAEAVKDLAYCLYDISANKRKDAKEATAYNALIADWTDLTREAAGITDMVENRQTRMNF